MATQENRSSTKERFLLAYSPQQNLGVAGYLILILIGIIFGYRYWYLACFNVLLLGYYLFSEMRLATVFYAVVLRVVMYPIAQFQKRYSRLAEEAEEAYQEKVSRTKNPLAQAQAAQDWILSNKKTVLFNFFYLCFYTMNAVVIGLIFLHPFTKERVDEFLRIKSIYPQFPISTQTWLPIVGEVDLAKYSPDLNLASAVGAGLVGFFEVAFNKKTDTKQLLLYLVGFPVGAYFITMIVPSGFEFALTVFEILTMLVIAVESILKKTKKQKLSPAWRKQAYG